MLWEGSCQASGGRGGRGSYRKASLWEAIQSLSGAGMSRPLGLVECGVRGKKESWGLPKALGRWEVFRRVWGSSQKEVLQNIFCFLFFPELGISVRSRRHMEARHPPPLCSLPAVSEWTNTLTSLHLDFLCKQ